MVVILVIEDDQSIREDIAQVLELEGYIVFSTEDGESGLALAQQTDPDLIICDVMMPKMDGYEVLAALRTESRTSLIPFIFLTARAQRDDIRMGMGLGADDYVTKPFELSELLSAVQTRLSRYRNLIGGRDKQIVEAQRKLTRMIAHELRTPLISISMSGDLLRRSGHDLSQAQFDDLLHTLDTGTRRMSHMVEQMIYTTQLESGMLVREAILNSGTVVPLWDLLMSTIPPARQFATRHRDLDIQLDERDSDASVLCDMPSLKHALAELIANALNFSPANGQVTVSQWKADDTIWISVTDQGRGISADRTGEVWRAFHQIERETHEQQGLGMGLPLAQRIFDVHGGEVSLESVEGKGTQITVSLPAAER